MSGLSDWADTYGEETRVGLVHAVANVVGLGFYSASLLARSRARIAKPRVRVWLSGALARPFLCGPVDGLKRWGEAVAFAEASAAAATGLADACSVELEDWPAPQAALAVAVTAATMQALHGAALSQGIVLRSVRPWWTVALSQALTESAGAVRMVAVSDIDSLTLLGGDAGRFDIASAYVPAPSPEHADKLLARVAMTAGIDAGQIVRMESAA